jgi:hypothetical protein
MSDNLDRNLRKLLRLSEKPYVPGKDSADRVFGNVMDRIKKEKEAKQPPVRGARPWIILAALAAMVLLAITVWRLADTGPGNQQNVAAGGPKTPAPNVVAPTVKMEMAQYDPKDKPETQKLKDGSNIEIAAGSRVKISTWSDRNRPLVELEAGEVRCEVAKGPGSFRVRTPIGSAVALGTEFKVRLENQAPAATAQGEEGMNRSATALLMTVAVVSGEVMVNDLDGMGRLACAGESVTVTQNQAIAENFRSGQLVPRLSDGRQGEPLAVRRHSVNVTVRDQIALIEVDQVFYNPSDDRLEGTFFFPLPNGSAICRLAMYVGDNLMEGEIAEAARARRTFEALKVQRVDPALLEWAGGNNFKMRVFPIEPKSEKRVLLSYYQVIEKENNRIKVAYPLITDALQTHPIGKLEVKLALDSTPAIEQVKVPGFLPEMERQPNHVALSYTAENVRPDKDFVAEFDLAKGEGELVVLPFWQAKDGDGYFLMVFSPQLETLDSQRNMGSRFIFVLDKSGGLGSKYLALARKTVESALTLLKPADQFDIVAYDTFAQPFRPGLVEASAENLGAAREFLSGLRAMGASDLSTAWQTAASLAGDQPTQIVYIGAGMSSLTSTKSGKLLQDAAAAFGTSPVRVHCMPLGGIQDADFINELAGRYSGTVRPLNSADDVEPGITDLMLDYGVPIYEKFQLSFDGVKVDEIYPKSLPNIAAGRQLFVYGKYYSQGAAKIELKAQYKNQPYHKVFDVNFGGQTVNTCIPPLWATRKIEHLQRETTFAEGDASTNIVRTIVETSKRYTVMSQYTSFLVLETPEDYARYGIERRVREFGPYAGQGGESAAEQLKLLGGLALDGKPGAGGGPGEGRGNFGARSGGGRRKALAENGEAEGGDPQAPQGAAREAKEQAKGEALRDAAAAPPAAKTRALQQNQQVEKQSYRQAEERSPIVDRLASNRFDEKAAQFAPPAPTSAAAAPANGAMAFKRNEALKKVAADKEMGYFASDAAFDTDQLAWSRTDIFPAIEGAPTDYLHGWPNQWKHSSEGALKVLRALQTRLKSLACEVTAYQIDGEGKEIKQGSVWQVAIDAANRRYLTYRKGEDTKDVCDGTRLARFFPTLKYAATRSASAQDWKALGVNLPGYILPWPERMDWEYEVAVEQGEGLVLRLSTRNDKWSYIRLFLDSEQGPVTKVEVYQHRQDGAKHSSVLIQTIRVEKFEDVGGIKVPTVYRIVNVPNGGDPRVLNERYDRRNQLALEFDGLTKAGKTEEAKALQAQLKPPSGISEQVIRLTEVQANFDPPAEAFKVEIPQDWAIRDLDATPKPGEQRSISNPYDPSQRGFGRR